MRTLRTLFGLCGLLLSGMVHADVVTRLPTDEKVVALTFDACEAWERVSFDRKLLDFLLSKKIPFTLFVTGKFVENNAADIQALSALDFVDIENHSWDHPNTMNRFDGKSVMKQVERAQATITDTTQKAPQFFRFPAGNYNKKGLQAVEALGLHVVHWRWASGDPSRGETAERLFARTMTNVAPGDILIFHINGRGVHTAEALPSIVAALSEQGYKFVLVSDYIGQSHPRSEPTPDFSVAARALFDEWLSRVPMTGIQSVLK